MLRVDREDATPLDRTTKECAPGPASWGTRRRRWVLVCYIDKGVLTPRLLSEMIRIARSQRQPVVVDSRRASDFSVYRGATVLTPNRFEAQEATGLDMSDAEKWPAVVSDFDAVRVGSESIRLRARKIPYQNRREYWPHSRPSTTF